MQRIIRVYARAGFTVQTVLMDNEFEKLKDHVPMLALNIPAASEHVGDIEQRIRVVKECARGLVCTLPYPHLPQQMLIHLIHFVTMWLNNFPTINGISSDYSPREIILRHRLSYKRHCHAPFGAYCETHEDNKPTNFFFSYNVLLCYALLTSVRIPLSVLPTVRPKCFTGRSPMCCANHGCIT